MSEWSAPDDRGVRTRVIHLSPRRRISGEREREAEHAARQGSVVLDEAQRALLKDLLNRYRAVWRWSAVIGVAGHDRVEVAQALQTVLLEAGYVRVLERRDPRGWHPVRVSPVDMPELRRLAGIPDRSAATQALAEALRYQPQSGGMQELLRRIPTGRLEIRLRRARLIPPLDRWLDGGRSGTRRDFALFATGHTKGIEDADWGWLESLGVLEAAGIIEHIPLLLVGGGFGMRGQGTSSLDVAAAGGPIGIPMSAVSKAAEIRPPPAWTVIENRTVFDRACVAGGSNGIIWVPGYAPTWWLDIVEALLDRAPAPALIACDPDPAGIEIAVRVLTLWDARALPWNTVGMDADSLIKLPVIIPLSQWDRDKLDNLPQLPARLDAFKTALQNAGVKGEQEGFFSGDRIAELTGRTR